MADVITEDNVFHRHLDDCPRCRNEPFNLCSKGSELLHTAVSDLTDSVASKVGGFENFFKTAEVR